MSTIVTRADKGSPLTNAEVDANFTNLNTDKYQEGSAIGATTPAAGTFTTLTATGQTSLGGVAGSETLRVNSVSGATRWMEMNGSVASNILTYAKGASGSPGFGWATAGSGTHDFGTGASVANLQLRVAHTASAVNYVQVTGAATGGRAKISTTGSDATVGMTLDTKGSGTLVVTTNGSGSTAFEVSPTNSPANYLRVASTATTVAPVLSAQGSDTNIDLTLTPKGTGNVVAGAGAFSGTHIGTWTGSAVGVAYGGTGSTTLTANNVLLGNGTSAVQAVAPGTTGNVLTSNGTTWVSSAPTGGVTSFNTRSGAITLTSSDVTTALTFTPYNSTNPSGFITSSGSISGNAATATYLSATQQTNAILGATTSLPMTTASGAAGSFTCRASGSGDANLAGITFWNDAYAIRMGIRSDGYFGLGGWSRAAWSWYSDPSGNMVAAGNVTAYSDERKKKNWRDVPTDLVEQLAMVKHGIYDRTDEDLTQIGVSAQSLQKVMPLAVTVGIDDWLAVNYGSAALVSAIQLAQRVVEQDKRIAQLEAIVAKLAD